jgi:hypothetical protein
MGIYSNQLPDIDDLMMTAWAGFPAVRVDIYKCRWLLSALTSAGYQTVIMEPAYNFFRVDFDSTFDAITWLLFYPSTDLQVAASFGTFAIDQLNLVPPRPSPIALIDFEVGEQFEPITPPPGEPIGRITSRSARAILPTSIPSTGPVGPSAPARPSPMPIRTRLSTSSCSISISTSLPKSS